MAKGVIFDMDGVLFDTERVYWEEQNQIAREWGFTFPEGFFELLAGSGPSRVRELFIGSMASGFDYDGFLSTTISRLDKRFTGGDLPLKPYVRETLEYLRREAYPIAIASGTVYNTILKYLSLTGLGGYFDEIVGGDMVAASKPDPECYIMAAARLGLDPRHCIAVEDSVNGVLSASAAGCVTVMVPDLIQPTDQLRGQAAVLENLSLLPRFIEAMKG